MTDNRTPTEGPKPQVEKLALSRETVRQLTEGEVQAEGGGWTHRWLPRCPIVVVRTRWGCQSWSAVGYPCVRCL